MHANKVFVLGLTGGIASGKTVASDALTRLGATVIDADVLSRELTAPGGEALPRIRECFGDAVFQADGALDRKALGAQVFHDEAARKKLEGILHPAVQRRMMSLLDEAAARGETLCVLSVPLLFETGMDALCDEVWVVTVEPETQLLRLMNRDRLTREQAEARVAAQMGKLERESRATALVRNDRQIEDTDREVQRLFKDLKSRIVKG